MTRPFFVHSHSLIFMRIFDNRYWTETHFSIAGGGYCQWPTTENVFPFHACTTAQVYKAIDLDTGRTCAVKVGRNREIYLREMHAYGRLRGKKGVARLLWDGWTGEGYIMILECLCANIGQIVTVCPFLSQTREASYLAIEMVSKGHVYQTISRLILVAV